MPQPTYGQPRQRIPGPCFNCLEMGHLKATCPKLNKQYPFEQKAREPSHYVCDVYKESESKLVGKVAQLVLKPVYFFKFFLRCHYTVRMHNIKMTTILTHHHPSTAPLSLKAKGMVDQTVEIAPRKLLINQSNELYLTELSSSRGSSLIYRKQRGCVTETRVGEKFWSGC